MEIMIVCMNFLDGPDLVFTPNGRRPCVWYHVLVRFIVGWRTNSGGGIKKEEDDEKKYIKKNKGLAYIPRGCRSFGR